MVRATMEHKIKKTFQAIGYEYTQSELNKLVTVSLKKYPRILDVDYYDIYNEITEYIFNKIVGKKVEELNEHESCVMEIYNMWLDYEQIRNTIFENYVQEDDSIKDFSDLKKTLRIFTEKYFQILAN